MLQRIKKAFTPGSDRIFYCQAVYGQKEIDAVVGSLKKGFLGPASYTKKFEQKVAFLFGKKYGLFLNSGSSANLTAVEIANLPQNCEVITQACTFPTTLSPLIIKGLIPVFVDSEAGTYNIDTNKIEGAISAKTKAICISHALGNINDMAKIKKICQKYKLLFIEDSCDTIGATYAGKPTGFWSDITTTSFYAAHFMTAAGGGGMVMTSDKNMIKDAKVFRDWGRALPENDDENINERFNFKVDSIDYDGKFTYLKLGYNFKPIELQSAFGLVQLKRLPKFNSIRARNFKRLYDFFKRYQEYFILPKTHSDSKTYWLAFPLTIRKESGIIRKNLLTYLEKNKIQTRLVFSGNILHHEPYRKINHRVYGSLDNTDTIMRQSFLIGCHHGMTFKMIDYMCEIFDRYLKKL